MNASKLKADSAMKEIPDVIICIKNGDTITPLMYLDTLHYYSHKLANQKSRITLTSILNNFDEDFYNMLEKLALSPSGYLLFKGYRRSKENGEDYPTFWKMRSAILGDYTYGMAADGDPSRFSFTFYGQIIEYTNEEEWEKYLKEQG